MTSRKEEGNDYDKAFVEQLKQKTMDITSIFTVTDFIEGKSYEEAVDGFGSSPIEYLRRQYPKFSKFVLEGFEINGRFLPLNTKTFISK